MKFKALYFTRFFFLIYAGLVVLFIAGFFLPWLFFIAKITSLCLLFITVIDIALLYTLGNSIRINRNFLNTSTHLSLGENVKVQLTVASTHSYPINIDLFEGYPVEMQERKINYSTLLASGKRKSFEYDFVPKRRGIYEFTSSILFVSSPFFLVKRRFDFKIDEQIHVYPSVIQMRKYELGVFNKHSQLQGLKKMRRMGVNQEFEQIRNYTQGDDLRSINWKATSRRDELMVNQYQEERAQQVYTVIDKSRSMQQMCDGMTLFDYAINTALVFSNIAIKKGDYAGLFTFSHKIGTFLKAERSPSQLKRIYELLYNQKTLFKEPNFPLAYEAIRRNISARSLLMFYTNFESTTSLHRALPVLRKLNQKHKVVVILFVNTRLENIAQEPNLLLTDIYNSAVAEQLSINKKNIAHELRQNGIVCLLSRPEDISVASINQYLELKATGKM
jgi:uncharacterized protein (DUF58 family)